MDVKIYKGSKRLEKPFEYFCNGCGQMRLSFVDIDSCGNCGSGMIIKGDPGTLDKDELKRVYYDGNDKK